MAKTKSTKRALIMSLLSLVICIAMLIGTTYAWFTDSVASGSNIIKSGNLDVALVDAQGVSLEGEMIEWAAADGRAQDEILWEPGCTYNTEEFYIKNVGNLKLKFKFAVSGIDGDAKLLEVIDFSVPADASQMNFNTGAVSVGTSGTFDLLKGYEVDTIFYGTQTFTEYVLEPGDEVGPLVLTGHMDENAGNEYQGLTVEGIAVSVLATQATGEEDSFDGVYDEKATYSEGPVAKVSPLKLDGPVSATLGMGGDVVDGGIELDTAFKFETTDGYEEAQQSKYRYWHADFVVSADKDVADGSIALAGYYAAYCDGYNDGNWVALVNEGMPVAAGEEIRLLELMLNGGSMSYEELCNWVPEFRCGAADLSSDGSNAGTTLTVELRLYEVTENAASTAVETGKYVSVGTYTHTF